MPRPRQYEAQKLEAYSIYTQRKAAGKDVSAVAIQVDLEEKHQEGTASYRVIANWVKEFKNSDERQALLDSPFEWHLMDQYGLPWEATSCLTEFLFMVEKWRVIDGAQKAVSPRLIIAPPFTVREAIWFWRLHQSAPEIEATTGNWLDVMILASQFVRRDMAADVLRQPRYMADLEALLLYKPYLDFGGQEVRHQAYHSAVDEGVIPTLRAYDIPLRLPRYTPADLPSLAWWPMADISISTGHPELLASQQLKLREAEAEVAKERLGKEKEQS